MFVAAVLLILLIYLSGFYCTVDAPDHDELIKAIMSLENSASSDVNVRELIANFPQEVSEVSLLAKLEDKESAAKLAAKVSNCDGFEPEKKRFS